MLSVHHHRHPIPIALLAVVLCTGLLSVVAVVNLFFAPAPSVLTVQTCSRADFIADGECDRPLDLGTLVMSEKLSVRITGSGHNMSEEIQTYVFTFYWVRESDGLRIEGDGPWELTFPSETELPYDLTWHPPLNLLAIFDGAPSGSDLGEWSIEGHAVSTDGDVADYSWIVVPTFQLIAPTR